MRGRVSDPFQPLRAAHIPNAPGSAGGWLPVILPTTGMSALRNQGRQRLESLKTVREYRWHSASPALAPGQLVRRPVPGATGQRRLIGKACPKHTADHDVITLQRSFKNFRRIKFKATDSPMYVAAHGCHIRQRRARQYRHSTESGSREFLTPSPHTTHRAGPQWAVQPVGTLGEAVMSSSPAPCTTGLSR
jgi:hypothetical protein